MASVKSSVILEAMVEKDEEILRLNRRIKRLKDELCTVNGLLDIMLNVPSESKKKAK